MISASEAVTNAAPADGGPDVHGDAAPGPMPSAASAEPYIRVEGLTKIYRTKRGDHTALDNVSIEVGEGEILVLLGPSGCGKTTLLRSVAGLERPDAGKIWIGGKLAFSAEDGVFLAPERRPLSMVFQSYALWPHMTVAKNVGYPLQNAKVGRSEIRNRVDEVLRTVGLEGLGDRYPGQLSGGQQQRVALARAIVASEGVVLFDEPLSNLDAKVRDRLRIELLTLQRSIGFSALYVTHDQAEASALADRIAVMNHGTIAQVGSPADVYHRPTSRYVAGFVGSVNEYRGVITEVSAATCTIDTPLGTVTGLAIGGGSLDVGDEAVLMFRPEHCELNVARPDVNLLSPRLLRSVFLGSQVDHVLEVGDTTFVVRTPEGEPLREGEPVPVSLDPARAWIFRAD